MLQKTAEKTSEAVKSSCVGLDNLVAKAGVDQLRSLDSISMPSIKSVNTPSRSMLGPTVTPSQLPFFAQSSVGANVRAPGLLSSAYSITDSAAVASQKLSLSSKGKPMALSLVQHEPQSSSLSSSAMPGIQHQLVVGSQNTAFGLINSHMRKAADSGLSAVLVTLPGSSSATAVKSVVAGVPPRDTYSLSSSRLVLPPVSSANIGLSTASSASVVFASSVPSISSVSKPVVARLMAQQSLPGVLALSGMPLCHVSVAVRV